MTDIYGIEKQLDLNAFNYNSENMWPMFRNIFGGI